MSSLNEGLSVGGAPEVGDTFAAALAEKFGPGGDPMDTPSEPATEPAEAPRDQETGQFTPKEVEEPAAPEAQEEEADTSEEGDPVVAAYLAKYGGDTDAAIKAAAEAQSLIGRQGQELGQTREELAELRGRLDQLSQQRNEAPLQSQEDVENRVIELSTTRGYFDAASQLANESLQGDSRAYDTVLSNWVLEDPIAAQRFDLDFQLWKREQAAPKPQPDPVLETVRGQQEVDNIVVTLGSIAAERGDAWGLIAPHMDAAIEQVHPSVAALVASTDADERLAGARIVADRAFILAQAAGTQSAAGDAAVARKTSGAQVASGSLRPAAAPAGSPESREDAIKSFKDEFRRTETTNISEGLTFGDTPK